MIKQSFDLIWDSKESTVKLNATGLKLYTYKWETGGVRHDRYKHVATVIAKTLSKANKILFSHRRPEDIKSDVGIYRALHVSTHSIEKGGYAYPDLGIFSGKLVMEIEFEVPDKGGNILIVGKSCGINQEILDYGHEPISVYDCKDATLILQKGEIEFRALFIPYKSKLDEMSSGELLALAKMKDISIVVADGNYLLYPTDKAGVFDEEMGPRKWSSTYYIDALRYLFCREKKYKKTVWREIRK